MATQAYNNAFDFDFRRIFVLKDSVGIVKRSIGSDIPSSNCLKSGGRRKLPGVQVEP